MLVLDVNESFKATDRRSDAALEAVVIRYLQFVYYFELLHALHKILDTAYKISIFESTDVSLLEFARLREYLILFLFEYTGTY
jgi:hypothetical protein